MKRKYLVVTGGAGFVGSNLINLLLKKTTYKIISYDNYSTGSKNNHIKNYSFDRLLPKLPRLCLKLRKSQWYPMVQEKLVPPN